MCVFTSRYVLLFGFHLSSNFIPIYYLYEIDMDININNDYTRFKFGPKTTGFWVVVPLLLSSRPVRYVACGIAGSIGLVEG